MKIDQFVTVLSFHFLMENELKTANTTLRIY